MRRLLVPLAAIAAAMTPVAIFASAERSQAAVIAFQMPIPVAEPAGLALLGSGMIVVAVFLRRLRHGPE